MQTAQRKAVGFALAFVVLMIAAALVTHAQTSTQSAAPKTPEVFCDGLSTGQLCLSNAPKVLNMDEAQKQRWVEAARQYNKAIDAATKQFLEQSKPTLTPAQFATMQKWFDKGLNPVLNQVLASNTGSK